MHYINYFTILVLLLPLFFVSTMFSPATFGEETPASIITPSNSICCKNETDFSSQTPSSTSVTNPLKQISTQEENPQKQIDETNADPSPSTFATPLNRINEERNEDSSDSFPKGATSQINGDNDNEGSNFADMIKNNLDKLLYSDSPAQSANYESNSDESNSDESNSDESNSDESNSDESNSDESSVKLEQLQSIMSNVFS
jgi:hypothetical protein